MILDEADGTVETHVAIQDCRSTVAEDLPTSDLRDVVVEEAPCDSPHSVARVAATVEQHVSTEKTCRLAGRTALSARINPTILAIACAVEEAQGTDLNSEVLAAVHSTIQGVRLVEQASQPLQETPQDHTRPPQKPQLDATRKACDMVHVGVDTSGLEDEVALWRRQVEEEQRWQRLEVELKRELSAEKQAWELRAEEARLSEENLQREHREEKEHWREEARVYVLRELEESRLETVAREAEVSEERAWERKEFLRQTLERDESTVSLTEQLLCSERQLARERESFAMASLVMYTLIVLLRPMFHPRPRPLLACCIVRKR